MSVGMVPETTWKPPASANGNHDNPRSGNHQAPSHWEKTQWKAKKKTKYLPVLTWETGWVGTKQPKKAELAQSFYGMPLTFTCSYNFILKENFCVSAHVGKFAKCFVWDTLK